MLNASRFKEIVVSRTPLKYHYYYSPAASGKPTLLFLHGFPSTAHDWNRQINYFQPKGYGILAPDMLGFGGTSRPTDVEYFRMSGMAADIIEILDNEKLGKVIGVAHDW
jgi:pimeloyl-ACP methyl ester carboxylesterase